MASFGQDVAQLRGKMQEVLRYDPSGATLYRVAYEVVFEGKGDQTMQLPQHLKTRDKAAPQPEQEPDDEDHDMQATRQLMDEALPLAAPTARLPAKQNNDHELLSMIGLLDETPLSAVPTAQAPAKRNRVANSSSRSGQKDKSVVPAVQPPKRKSAATPSGRSSRKDKSVEFSAVSSDEEAEQERYLQVAEDFLLGRSEEPAARNSSKRKRARSQPDSG